MPEPAPVTTATFPAKPSIEHPSRVSVRHADAAVTLRTAMCSRPIRSVFVSVLVWLGLGAAGAGLAAPAQADPGTCRRAGQVGLPDAGRFESVHRGCGLEGRIATPALRL